MKSQSKKEIEIEYIRREVQDAMACCLESFDFYKIIDNTDALTPKQKAIAKEKLDWLVITI
jgi:hypothetical protein